MSQVDVGSEGCPACGQPPELLGRYRLDRELEGVVERGRLFRATRRSDAMLSRACVVELGPALDLDQAEALVDQLRGVEHSKLARIVEVWLDRDQRRLWTVHEPVGGHALAELVDEGSPRLADPRWLLSTARQLGELLAHLHAQQPPILGAELGLEALVVRHRVGGGGGRRGGPPRLSLLELRLGSLGQPDPPTARADLRRLGRSLQALVELDERPSEGADEPGVAELRALVERLIVEAEPELGATELLAELDAISARRQSAPPTRASRKPPTAQPKPASARMDANKPPPLSRESVCQAQGSGAGARDDVPVSRPADLSRELSQAHRATAAVEAAEARERKQLSIARLMLVVLVALIAALATYALSR